MGKYHNKRGKWEIIYYILKSTRHRKFTKTKIMHEASLDWRNFVRHFNFLLDKGFILKQDNSGIYEVTAKGEKLLKQLDEINKTIAPK